jgi:hypothetical protein
MEATYWFPGWKTSDSGQEKDFPMRTEAKSDLVQIEVPSGRHSVGYAAWLPFGRNLLGNGWVLELPAVWN